MQKLEELRALSETESLQIICIVETWLSNVISDNELMIPDYHIIRHDRDRHGGDVMMYVHSSLAVNMLCPITSDVELLLVSVSQYMCSYSTCIGVFYRPPSSNIDVFDCLSNQLCALNPS